MKYFIILIILFLNAFIFIYPVFAQTTPEEAESIREKVQQQLEDARNNPKAYLGVVTDKTENSLQIRNGGGEILQISTTEQTTYAAIGRTTTSISYDDVAIGDFIVAMGFIEPNNVLEARRILQTEPLTEPTRGAIMATVENAATRELTVTDKRTGNSYLIKPANNISITFIRNGEYTRSSFTAIDEEDTLIIVGVINGNSIDARRIHILPLSETSPTPIITN